MAVKFILFALVVTVATFVKAEDCDCKEPGDTKEFWEFLKKVSPDLDNLNDEDKDLYSVLPGLLSPLFECNCLDKNRRKRDVSIEVEAVVPLNKEGVNRIKLLRERRSIRFGTRSCPAGFAKVGYLCVKEELLD